MPANPNDPFGFKYIGKIDGNPPNYGSRTGLVASGNTNKIFTGDPLKPDASGYLDVSVVVGGGTAIGGVAQSFSWISKSQNKTVYQNWWPGNGDASGDVTCFYQADSGALFEVQCLLGPVTQANVGSNANFNVGSGGAQIGAGNQSSFTLDDGTLGSGASLPFKVYNLPVKGPLTAQYATAGYDPTQAYNRVWVTINNLTA